MGKVPFAHADNRQSRSSKTLCHRFCDKCCNQGIQFVGQDLINQFRGWYIRDTLRCRRKLENNQFISDTLVCMNDRLHRLDPIRVCGNDQRTNAKISC